MRWSPENRTGLIGTLIFHAIIAMILLFLGFRTPLPLPEEKGILVNFGDGNDGMGKIEPSKNPSPKLASKVVERKAPVVKPDPVSKTEPKSVAADKGAEKLMTQDFEESVALNSGKAKNEEKSPEQIKKEEEARIKKAREEKLRREKELAEKLKREEELRIQKELEEKIRKEKELEEKRLKAEAEERKRKEEEARKISQINSRVKNAFGSTGKVSQENTSTGEGVTYKPGNQGSENGSVNSTNHAKGGGFGDGISYSLAGRSPKGLPKPVYPGNEEGYVVVEVNVDRNGKVIKAIAGVKGSTTMNAALLKSARDAALNASFNADPEASAIQVGTITYHFILN